VVRDLLSNVIALGPVLVVVCTAEELAQHGVVRLLDADPLVIVFKAG
jgi:hypothetical protein